jgi:DNA-dependent RNA polymerase auxiliary subunit epsilon
MQQRYRKYLEQCFNFDIEPLSYDEWLEYEKEREY